MGITVQKYMELSEGYFGEYTPAFFRETIIGYLAKCSDVYREKLLKILVDNEKRTYGPPDMATLRSYEEWIRPDIKTVQKLLPRSGIKPEDRTWMQKHIKHLLDALAAGDKQKLDELHLIGLKRAWKDGDEKPTLEAFELERQGLNLNNVPDSLNGDEKQDEINDEIKLPGLG